jgi:hypothetical protein
MALDVASRRNPHCVESFNSNTLDDKVHIPPILPGEILFLRADCVHRTGHPVLNKKETRVAKCHRLHILVGPKHAVNVQEETIVQPVDHPQLPKTANGNPSLDKSYKINQAKWSCDEEAKNCNQIKDQNAVPVSPLPIIRLYRKTKKAKTSP